MSGSSRFTISDEALQQATEAGMEGDALAQLHDMARRAAPFTHEIGNRRFREWWLRIEQGVVTEVGPLGEKAITPGPVTEYTRTEKEKREAKLRVERAIAQHFPRKKPTT